jgi:hypothetical protein
LELGRIRAVGVKANADGGTDGRTDGQSVGPSCSSR